MKKICITGKHNIDELDNLNNKPDVAITTLLSNTNNTNNTNTRRLTTSTQSSIRCGMECIDETKLPSNKQLNILLQLYIHGTITDIDQSINKDIGIMIREEIVKKIQGYKQQDIKRDIYIPVDIIGYESVLEKLISCKLKCKYCLHTVLVIYKNVREPYQWSLDRIDNEIGHTTANTVISCLQCNLQRRNTSHAKFIFTKHMKVSLID